jgi:hypothetical protein
MVKQGTPSKTSSSHFQITGRVSLAGLFQPETTNIENGHIIGTYSLGEIFESEWKVLPHVALANLPTYDDHGEPSTRPDSGLRIDPKSVEWFVRTYGGFRGAYSGEEFIFDQDIAEVAKLQNTLRRAWSFPPELGTAEPMMGVQEEIGWDLVDEHSFALSIFPGYRYDTLLLSTDDLWKFISYLFLRDYSARKIGVCENPGCPAPYFLKGRKDQKYCELGPCTEYAHRQYALKWWREKGERRRAKKRKSPGRTKR